MSPAQRAGDTPGGSGTPRLGVLRGGSWVIVALLLVWAALVGVIHIVGKSTGFEPVTCLFRRVTGLPCATCGSTRAAFALVRGDVLGALVLNPMVTVLLVALPVWAVLSLIRRGVPRAPWSRAARRLAWVAAAVIFLGNWAYILWHESAHTH